MLQRWLRICWKWSTFWKACKKKNTWECWISMGCNQQRSATGNVRTRSWSADSKNYCVWDFDTGSRHETCHPAHMITQWHLPPPFTSIVKSLFTHVHSSQLSLVAGLHWCCTKFILRLLLREQMENHAAVANSFIQTATNEPDLAPYDFWLFSKLKSPLKGKRFQTYNEIQENTMQQLMVIPKKDFAVFWTLEQTLGELCEVPRCLLWRGLRHHCPLYNLSCMLYLTQ